MTKRNPFILAVAVPLLILLAMTVKPTATVLFGQTILLETQAVDPTDLFRGEYVTLNFKISDVPKSKGFIPEDKRDVYVSLKQEGKYYVVDSISVEKPKQGIYLKGKIQYGFNQLDQYRVDYSLDKYFVEQGSGGELQQESYHGTLAGTVKVLDGYGVLTKIDKAE